jgi:hypothetical protein
MTHMTVQPNSFQPDPQDPFALDPQPESFSLDMVEQYSALPTGVMEMTPNGVYSVSGEALSLLDDESRVFVARHAGALGIDRAAGPALDLDGLAKRQTIVDGPSLHDSGSRHPRLDAQPIPGQLHPLESITSTIA